MPRPMTMAEKILAAHAGLDEVEPGQLIECDLDLVLSNDVTAPIAVKEFRKIGVEKVFNPTKIALVPDHYVPNKDIKSAEQAKIVRDFAREQGITHYYEVGCMGVEHALLPEQGVVGAGDLIIGADSHTCTYGALGAFATGVGSTDAGVGYATGKAWFKVPESLLFKIEGELAPGVTGKDVILHIIGMIGVDGALYQAMEFTGSAIRAMDMDERMSISNMAIEAGGKAGLIEVDDVTRAYLDGLTERPYTEYHSDADATYAKVYEIDAASIVPTVSFPHLPSNTRPAAEARDVKIDQAVIGSCTNRRHAPGRRRAARPHGASRRALHRDPRHAGGVSPVHGGRPHGRVPRRELRRVHAYVRPLPGRLHGHSRRRRARHRHDEPQLRRPHGRPHQRGVPVLAGHRRGKRRARPHRPAGRPGLGGAAIMQFKGTAHRYGRDIDTDVIIPARYLTTSDPAELAKHCLEDLDTSFVERVQPGDIIVADENFGCGSSREHAPIAIKAAGVDVVIAKSFARIFYRNSINTGLAIMECPEAVDAISQGDVVSVDADTGVIVDETTGQTYQAQPLPPFIREIIEAGGLINRTKAKLGEE